MRHAFAVVALLQLVVSCAHDAAAAATTPPYCNFARVHPRRYAVRHLQSSSPSSTRDTPAETITVDGLLNESAWEETPWSEAFVDIQGARHWSQPWFTTKAKMRYDDAFLYVGAYMEETAVWANVTQRNAVVFADNDFEVFVDADGSTHNYKELEVNARNTTWNLLLNRPYRDGGHENSTRVDPVNGFDMFGKGLKSAVFMKGRPNDPAQQLHFWTVEIRLPLKELALHTKAVVPPRPLSFWRINFSRVEWAVSVNKENRYVRVPGQAEDNWVWNPQHAVNMHMPENWGYIQFRPSSDDGSNVNPEVPLDPEWNVRYLSFQLYYAQHAFKEVHGRFSATLSALRTYFSSTDAFECLDVRALKVNATAGTFEALVKVAKKNDQGYVASIRDDSLIHVRQNSGEISSVQ